MDHGGGEAARPTMVESTDFGMVAAVHGGEAHNMTSGTFHGQLGAAAARCASFEPTVAAYQNYPEFARHVRAASGGVVPVAVFHREPGPGVVYANVGTPWRQLGAVDALLVGTQFPDGVVQGHDSSSYSALQLRPGGGQGEVLVDLLPGDANAVYNDYGYYTWQPRPGAGRGEVSIGPLLPDGVGAVFNNSSNFAQQTLPVPDTERADVIASLLRGSHLGAGYDGSGVLAGTSYNNLGMVAEHLRRLLPFVGIGACSVAVNGLATGPGSPAVAFHFFALPLGGMFLVILHVLRV